MISGYHTPVADHYEKFPYPVYPWYSLGSWRDMSTVDTRFWGAKRDIQDIWIAGCGTIAPAMFGRRNYFARIWATDLSERTLKIAKRRLRLLGIRNVHLRQEDVFESNYSEAFDAVDSFGVLHHTVSPQRALSKLAQSLRPGGVLRFMVYSQEARQKLEELRKEVIEQKLISLDAVENFLRLRSIDRKGDLYHPNSVADALLNPVVHTYTEEKVRELVASVPSLSILKFDSTSNFILHSLKV
jgi:SAM-dependent methyltransferase